MKKSVVIIFGGQSSEHDISRRSVMTVLEHIDYTKYEIHRVGITRDGEWLLFEGDNNEIIEDTWTEKGRKAHISPDGKDQSLVVEGVDCMVKIQVDVIIPVLHGAFGEDGTIQGLFKLAKIPYVGCGVLASAVAMDKFYTKVIVDAIGIRQAKWVKALKESYDQSSIATEVAGRLGYPVFVKPSNAGSSIGVSKADDSEQLHEALQLAFRHDRKVLIEEAIVGREVECAVLGNLEVVASDVGEILAADEFYDFDSKYNNAESKTVSSAEMSEKTRETIRRAAVEIFKAIDGRGLSRVDFFIEESTGDVVFNEINTFPGFTNISMYPMLFEAEGISNTELIDRLIDLAIQEKELY